MSLMCRARSTRGRIRCDRSPRPLRVGVKTSCPAALSRGVTSRQHQPPCHEPWTSTNVAIGPHFHQGNAAAAQRQWRKSVYFSTALASYPSLHRSSALFYWAVQIEVHEETVYASIAHGSRFSCSSGSFAKRHANEMAIGSPMIYVAKITMFPNL